MCKLSVSYYSKRERHLVTLCNFYRVFDDYVLVLKIPKRRIKQAVNPFDNGPINR